MNSIMIHGKIIADAKMVLLKNEVKEERPMVIFEVSDSGMPYQKKEALSIEVHFQEEAAMHIYQYLKKDKEVIVQGFLKERKFFQGNQEIKKHFISAKLVMFTPLKKDMQNG